MDCPRCRTALTADARFCGDCGLALTRACPACQQRNALSARFCAECGAPQQADALAPAAAPLAVEPAAAPARVSRRQMSVLFCDLVGSTELAQRLDPEDLMEALQAYHQAVRQVAARLGGFVARIVGDGVDLYFGFPMAGEDDAVRALHAGLAIVDEVHALHPSGRSCAPLQVRVGIATGMVAVGGAQAIAIAGSTPNLAARIEAAVPPGTVGVAPGTRRIAGAQFEFEDLGPHSLKGFDGAIHVFALRGASALDSRSAWRGRDSRLPMVGRQAELAQLQQTWAQVVAGQTCAALIRAEAGFGKSRLVTAFDQALPDAGHTLVRLQCSPFHCNSALQPFVQHLSQAAGFVRHDTPAQQLEKLEAQLAVAGLDDPRDTSLLAALLGVATAGRYPALAMPPPMQLQLTKEALTHYFAGLTGTHGSAAAAAAPRLATADHASLTRYFVGLAEQRPLVLVCEDLHWIDPTSLELLQLLLANGGAAPILLLLTARPEFAPDWAQRPPCVTLSLQRLDDAAVARVAAQLSPGAALTPAQLATIVAKTDGVPLYVEELTRMMLDGGDGHVPDTLVDLLTERLDRLGPGKALAQVAAVLGRDFDRGLLLACAELLQPALDAQLQSMLVAGLILPASHGDERFLFKHALVEDTAYASIPGKRRAALHGRVADALLSQFSDRVALQPELAARHLGLAGRGLQGGGYWQAAGGQALGRGAPREAAGHLRQGLLGLQGVAESAQRGACELGLLSMLGPTTMVLMGPGSAEFGRVQQRAHALCHALPGRPRLFPITYGLCLYHWGRAELSTAQRLAAGLLEVADADPDNHEATMAAHNMAGMVAYHLGDAPLARRHLARSVALYEPQRDAALYPVYLMDFGVFGRFYLALATLASGEPERARQIAQEAFALAGGLNQPHTLGFSMLANFVVALMRGDPVTARQFAQQCIGFASQFGFPEFIAMAQIAQGWARAHADGEWDAGLAELRQGVAGWQATGFENWQSWFAALEAEMLGQLGRADEGLALLARQFVRIAANGERQFEALLLAEQALLRARRDPADAGVIALLDQAQALAQAQGAVAWVERVAQRRASLHRG